MTGLLIHQKGQAGQLASAARVMCVTLDISLPLPFHRNLPPCVLGTFQACAGHRAFALLSLLPRMFSLDIHLTAAMFNPGLYCLVPGQTYLSPPCLPVLQMLTGADTCSFADCCLSHQSLGEPKAGRLGCDIAVFPAPRPVPGP